jgi:hypothetical protein
MDTQKKQQQPVKLVPNFDGYYLGDIALEIAPDGRIVKASVQTYAGVLEIGTRELGTYLFVPSNSCLTLKFIPSPKPEEFTDSDRLKALLMNADKFWTRRTESGAREFCGNQVDWHGHRQAALDDLVRSMREPEPEGAPKQNAEAMFSKASTTEQIDSEKAEQPC